MPYNSREDLPENVTNVLPVHAQDIFKEAFNSAYKQYENPEDRNDNDSRENTARKVAWAAVKEKYEKGDDGSWHPKN
jgi:cation transport regulator